MKVRLRILMVSTYFHPIVGGAERQAFALAKQLLKEGHSVTVATCRFPHLQARETVEGIHIHRIIRPVSRGVLYGGSYLTSLGTYLWMRRRDYDLIHVHLLFLDALAAGVIGGALKKPIVVKAACGGDFGDVARLERVGHAALWRAGFQRINRVVATSGQVVEELVGYGMPQERIIQIPNSVDVERYRPSEDRERAKRSLGLVGDVVVFVGRLDPQKGLGTLLDAWGSVVAARPHATLYLMGKGLQEAQLRLTAQQRGLSDHVVFCGEQRDVLPYLQAADLFVLPSLAEGMSNALLEAMACGLPCVATRIGGTVEVIQDGVNGCLVERDDAQGLANMLISLLSNPTLAHQLGWAARRTVEERYPMPRVVDRYLMLYEELLNPAIASPASRGLYGRAMRDTVP